MTAASSPTSKPTSREGGDVVLTNGDYALAITYYVGQYVDLGECGEAARNALGW
jgi:hypothetical protein